LKAVAFELLVVFDLTAALARRHGFDIDIDPKWRKIAVGKRQWSKLGGIGRLVDSGELLVGAVSWRPFAEPSICPNYGLYPPREHAKP
jgi:hypothetical protein